MKVIGPDEGFVGRQECVRGRDCFRGVDD
jgi:hypothetical protein